MAGGNTVTGKTRNKRPDVRPNQKKREKKANNSKMDEGRDEQAPWGKNVDPNQAVSAASTREKDSRDEQTHGKMEEKLNLDHAVSAAPTLEEKRKFFNACECGDLQTIQSTFHNFSKEEYEQLLDHAVVMEVEIAGEKVRCQVLPLHVGARNGHAEVCRVLLEKGAKVDAEDDWGQTPLHWAAKSGHENCIAVLLEAGAQVTTDMNPNTLFHLISQPSNKTRLILLMADCECSDPQMTDVLFSHQSRLLMDSLRDILQKSQNPVIDLCQLQAAFHRRAGLRRNVADDMEGHCRKVEQLLNAALNIPLMDDPEIFLKAWDCNDSLDFVNHSVVKKLIDNKVISVLALPQIQHHFQECFNHKSLLRGSRSPNEWRVQDWRRLPIGFIFSELLFRCVYLILTIHSARPGGAVSLNLGGDPSHCLLLIMTLGYMLEEVVQFLSQGKKRYSNDPWNIFDIAGQACFFGWALSSNIRCLYFNHFVLPFRTMHYLCVFKGIGAFVTVLMRMIRDTCLFLISFSIILAGYALMCTSLLREDYEDNFDNFQVSALTLFAASLGDFDFDDFLDEATNSFDWGGVALLSIFLLLAMVMALNMLIAILSDTYSRLSEHGHGEWCLVFDGIVLESLVEEEKWPGTMKLPAPLSIVSWPFVWLSRWTKSVWPAYVAVADVFFVDIVVHFAVGLPWALVSMRSEVWETVKSWELPFRLGYVAYPFVLLLEGVLAFFNVIRKSFDELRKSFGQIQTSVGSNLVVSKPQENGSDEREGAEPKPEWLTEMRKVLQECPITEDENASGQVLEAIAKLEDKLGDRTAKLEDAVEEIKALLLQLQHPPK